MIPDQHKRGAAWIGIAAATVMSFEGLRTLPYFDVTGVPTACFGETQHIDVNARYTPDECERMLMVRLERDYGPAVDHCTHVDLPPARKAAAVDFAYNLGTGTYCKHIAPKFNAGRIAEGCDAMLRFDHAGGKVYRGLTRRREQDRAMCIEGTP